MIAIRFSFSFSLFLFALCINHFAYAQDPQVAKLVHPDVADRLSLDDSQRAAIQALLQRKAEAIAAQSDPAEKEKTGKDFNQQILALLTDQQRAKFVEAPPPQKLMFQFREMKWDDVLDWFASQQDLTLVMDQVPPGTFSYTDTRSYSPAEGIDLLNSVLMTRKFSLVRREKMLVVMALNDSIPVELLPRVKLEELPNRGRFELVSVVFPLGGRPVDDVLQEIKPFLSTFGRALPLAQGSQVVVIETAGKMQTINELIASVPVPKRPVKPDPAVVPQPVFAAYTLGDLDANRALETIRKLIPSEQITADAKTGILSAYLIPAQHTAVKLAIDQMIESAKQVPTAESAAYPLSGALGEDLKKQILTLAPNAAITATVDRLLVIARPEDQQLIKSSLAAMEIHPIDSSKSMKIFDMDIATVPLVETALKSFLPKGQIASNKAGSLIVRGTEEDLKIASEMVEVLKRSQSATQPQLRVFPLEQTADPKWLLTLQKIVPAANAWLVDDSRQLVVLATAPEIKIIESLLPQLISLIPKPDQRKLQIYALSKTQLARRATLTDLPSNLLTIKIVDSTNKQELLVWATPEQHSAFAKLLEGLDLPAPSAVPAVPKIYPLLIQDGPLVVQILTAEFPDSKITIDLDGESLTVLADENTQTKIASRVNAYNEQLPKKRTMRLETYSVRGMTAASLQLALTPLLAKARVNVDTVKSRLLVSADEKTHTEIAQLITALSEKMGIDQQPIVVAYPVEHALPSQIKIVFDQLALGTTSIADDKLKQLVVTGTLESQAVAKATITQIDRPLSSVSGSKEIRSYEAKKLQAATLVPTLQKLWPDMQLTADATANRVIASGTIKELDQLEEAMQRLISSPDGKPQLVKTYPVPAGDMLTLPTILGQIAPQAIVSSDIPSRTVTVWAGEEQHSRVEQALQQISKTAQAAKEPATYVVKPTQVVAVQTALTSLFPNIGVASVPTSGQLIVVASPEQQKRISEVIELLAAGSNSADRTIRVFRVEPERIDLASLLNALQSTLPSQIRLESNATNNTILAIGSAEELDMVTLKMEELQKQMPAPELATSVVYTLKHTPTAGAITVLTTLVPKATLVQDPTSRTIAATAKANDHKKIEELLKQYDLPKSTSTYHVKPTQVTMATVSLRTLFPLMEMTSDPLTGRLIVIAPPDQQERVSEIIELLANGPNAADRLIKVFSIDQDRIELASMLNALQLTLPSQIRLETNPRNGTLLVVGTQEEITMVGDKIAQLQQELPINEPSSTAVYPLKYGSPASALTILQSLVPKAVVVQDVASKTISASAKKHEHERIQEFLRSFDIPKTTSLDTHVYRLRQGSAMGLAAVLTSLMPDATVFGSREEGVLIATATVEQHRRIDAIVKDFDVDMQNSETRVFSIGKGNAATLKLALQGFSLKASTTADTTTNSLIVTAPAAEMERIAQIVSEVESGGSSPKLTKYYPLVSADPVPLAKALLDSFPKSGFSADSISGGVFATATENDHAEISRVIEEVNAQPTKLPTLRAFVLRHANPSSVAEALTSAFGRRSSAGVSFSKDAKSVFVVASNQELIVAEKLVEQLDVPKSTKEEKRLQLFSLGSADSKSVTTSIESLFKDDASAVDVRYDPIKEQLFVTGKESQLKLVEEAVKQFLPPKRELEIIQLNAADPFSFKRAVNALFEDEPLANAPTISVDSSLQQVLVRATQEQMGKIRELLKQLGESQPGSPTVGGTGRLRIVPIHRSSQQLLQDIQKLWPTLRRNPINVVNPQPADNELPRGVPAPPKAAPGKKDGVGQRLNPARAKLTSTVVNQEEQQAPLDAAPPIIVVTGQEQWTLASDDSDALDLFTRLLDTLMNPKVTPIATAGEFSVYILRHADAKHLKEILTDLFRTNESGRRDPLSEAFQRVKIVADSRINALVIGGNRADRRIVEELLSVFDSEDLLDTLQQISPTMVQLRNASAKNVSDILKEVYKAQLKADAGRGQIDIPEGVSGEVAVMLQQINAQSSGPLLSAAIDETTNSIILRGPPTLLQEVRTFIEKVDLQSGTASARRVQVLRLEATNTKNLEKALNLLKGK